MVFVGICTWMHAEKECSLENVTGWWVILERLSRRRHCRAGACLLPHAGLCFAWGR